MRRVGTSVGSIMAAIISAHIPKSGPNAVIGIMFGPAARPSGSRPAMFAIRHSTDQASITAAKKPSQSGAWREYGGSGRIDPPFLAAARRLSTVPETGGVCGFEPICVNVPIAGNHWR